MKRSVLHPFGPSIYTFEFQKIHRNAIVHSLPRCNAENRNHFSDRKAAWLQKVFKNANNALFSELKHHCLSSCQARVPLIWKKRDSRFFKLFFAETHSHQRHFPYTRRLSTFYQKVNLTFNVLNYLRRISARKFFCRVNTCRLLFVENPKHSL